MNKSLPDRLEMSAIVIGESGPTVCWVYVPPETGFAKIKSINCDNDGTFLLTEGEDVIRLGDFDKDDFDAISESEEAGFRINVYNESGFSDEYDIDMNPRERHAYGA